MLFGKRNGERDSDRVECKKSDYKIRLCSEFAFSSTDMLIESAKNDSDS